MKMPRETRRQVALSLNAAMTSDLEKLAEKHQISLEEEISNVLLLHWAKLHMERALAKLKPLSPPGQLFNQQRWQG